MSFAWKEAGLTYNRYLSACARVVRRSLKEEARLQAERRGDMDLKFARWENGKQGKQGEVRPVASTVASGTQASAGA